MKRILYIIVSVAMLTSCENYFDQEPKTELHPGNIYSTYDGALSNLGELYARMGSVNEGINGVSRFQLPSIVRGGSQPFQIHSMSDLPRNLWRNYYAFIAQANSIINNIESYSSNLDNTYMQSTLESAEIEGKPSAQLLAEARFMRAYAYFNLYRYFGGVPLIVSQAEGMPDYTPRSSRQDIFKFLYDEMEYALENCVDNRSGIAYGRVTKGTIAGHLAKMKVFHASYIRRAKLYGAKLNETADGDVDINTLYDDAMKLCDDIIAKVYGDYELVDYYPAIFTTENSEVMFSVLAEEGSATGNEIPMGFPGPANHGANGGQVLTSWVTVLYDVPTWDHDHRFKTMSRDYGKTDRFNDELPKPGTTTEDLPNLFASMGKYTLTGDDTRRMWNSVKGWVTGTTDGAVNGLWVFEPAGEALGEEFFIPPGKGLESNYTAAQLKVMDLALESHERPWWRDNAIGEAILYNVNVWCLGKFRNANPWSLSGSFSITESGVDYPLLRLAEIYLLKAEIHLMNDETVKGIDALNVLRDRACHQGTMRDMFLNGGDAAYSYTPGSVVAIPTSLTNAEAIKEMLYERIRELVGEDDCGWLDLSRYPDILMENLEDMCMYGDPIRGQTYFADATNNEYLWDMFNDEKIYKVLLPIPNTELSFFPEMGQNPGY